MAGRLRTLDAGISTVEATDADGSALDLIQSAGEDAERGIVVMGGDGKVTFLRPPDV